MTRVLLLAPTTGYQTRLFGEAAAQLGIELVFATDRCDHLDDPWRDRAIAIRFHDEQASIEAIGQALGDAGVAGVLALGDRPTVIAAEAAAALRRPWHPAAAARAARDKTLTRARFAAAGLRTPWSMTTSVDADPAALAADLPWPVVIKPTILSGSRGVMRADTPEAFTTAFARLRRILDAPDVRALREPAGRTIQIESYIDGVELALEGLLDRGTLRTLALFDKPDPLDGPFFEETIYVTPSRLPAAAQTAIETTIAAAARALGLWHGPIHAECRVAADGIYVLEVAARPIGGYCARALSFVDERGDEASFEALLLSHAAGRDVTRWQREPSASGVMMIPIPRAGIYRGVQEVDAASAVPHVTGVQISVRPEQRLVPLPEGASYLGFIFARAETPALVETALREAHARLRFDIETSVPLAGQ